MKTLIALLMTVATMGSTVPEDAIFVAFNDESVVAVVELIHYDLATGLVSVTTTEPLVCDKDADRLFNDRFQENILRVNINGSDTVVLENFEYYTGAGIITIETKDPLVCV